MLCHFGYLKWILSIMVLEWATGLLQVGMPISDHQLAFGFLMPVQVKYCECVCVLTPAIVMDVTLLCSIGRGWPRRSHLALQAVYHVQHS